MGWIKDAKDWISETADEHPGLVATPFGAAIGALKIAEEIDEESLNETIEFVEGEEKSVNKDISENRKFVRKQEQCALLFWADKIAEKNRDFAYRNFYILDDDSTMLVSKLLSRKGVIDLFNLTTAQASALVPRLRIFKFYTNEDGTTENVEFPFPSHTLPESLHQFERAFTGDVGIKSFSYNLNGGDIATKYILTAQLELVFRTLEDLDTPLPVKNTNREVRFLDLLRTEGADQTYNPEQYVIKALLGWAPDIGQLDLFPDDLIKSLDGFSTVLVLNVKNHTLDLNEDGTINLSIDFAGSIDLFLASQKANVLSSDATEALLKEIEKLEKNKEHEIKLSGINKEQLEKLQKFAEGSVLLDENFVQNTFEKSKGVIEIQKVIDEKLGQVNALFSENYLSLFNSIISNNKLFYIDVDKSFFGYSVEPIKIIGSEQEFQRTTRTENEEELQKLRRPFRDMPAPEIKSFLGAELAKKISASGGAAILAQDDIEKLSSGEGIGAVVAQGFSNVQTYISEASTSATGDILDPSKFRISFFYLGDLIDAAYVRAKNQNKKLFEKTKLIIGNVQIFVNLFQSEFEKTYGINSVKKQEINICDIPISVNLFMNWFQEEIVRKDVRVLSFYDFLRSILTTLIQAAVTSHCLEKDVPGIAEVDVTNISLPGMAGAVDPIEWIISTNITGNRRLNLSKPGVLNMAKSVHLENSLITPRTQHYNYLYLNSTTLGHVTLQGNREEDFEQGVYHFFIGNGKGLLKRIKLKKNDRNYITEANLEKNAQNPNLEILRNFYDAELTLIGNSIFFPGQMIYLNPLLSGFGSPQERASLAKKLGIGGYYTILEVNTTMNSYDYETILVTRWISFGDEPPAVSAFKKIGAGVSNSIITRAPEFVINRVDELVESDVEKTVKEINAREAAKERAEKEAEAKEQEKYSPTTQQQTGGTAGSVRLPTYGPK